MFFKKFKIKLQQVIRLGGKEVSQMRGWGVNLPAQLKPIFFDFVLEGASADPEESGGPGSILTHFI